MVYEEDACTVCYSERAGPKNPIIFCDGKACNLPVHKRCYSVDSVPEGKWFCDKCKMQPKKKVEKHDINVICCPTHEGALHHTVIPKGFMHVVCAMWNKDIDHTVLPYNINEKLLNSDECTQCNVIKGFCIKCQHPGCSNQYHVTCAIDAEHLSPASFVSDKFEFYCPTHQPAESTHRRALTSRKAQANKRRRKKHVSDEDEEDDISDDLKEENDHMDEDDDDDNQNDDDDDDDNSNNGDDDDGDDDDDEDVQDNSDGDNGDDDEDSDDDMGLVPRKRNKPKSSSVAHKRRATASVQRKGPIKLFLDDQNSSDDDMGTTRSNGSSSSSSQSKLSLYGEKSTQRQQPPDSYTTSGAMDIDRKKEPSPTNSVASNSSSSGGSGTGGGGGITGGSVLSLTERLKAKRNKMDITHSRPTSSVNKKPSVSSGTSPSLALDLNKPASSGSSSSSTPTSTMTLLPATTASPSSKPVTKTGLLLSSAAMDASSIATSTSPSLTSSTITTTAAAAAAPGTLLAPAPTSLPSLPANQSGTSSTMASSSSSSSSLSTPPSLSSSFMNRPMKQKLPNKTHLAAPPLKSSLNGNSSNVNGNMMRSGNTPPSSSSSLSNTSSMASISTLTPSSAFAQIKKVSGINSSNSNTSSSISKPVNATKVMDLDEIQNDIRAQHRANSSSMDMNNGINNGLHRSSIMDRKNSQQQQQPNYSMDLIQQQATRNIVAEVLEQYMGQGRNQALTAEIQQLQTRIHHLQADLRRATEFKKNVAEVFEALQIQLPGSTQRPAPGRMFEYIEGIVSEIKSIQSRTAPINDETRDRVVDYIQKTIKDGSF